MKTIETSNNTSIETVLHELATLRSENSRLRQRLSKRQRGATQTVRKAIVDAHAILMNAYSGEPTGRSAMASEGMTKHRWKWAVAFLRYAGVVSSRVNDWRHGLLFDHDLDLAKAVKRLEIAATELDHPDGYKRLKSLIKHV